MPTGTGPPLSPFHILSNYLEQYRSYGLHKISASGEITTEQRVSLAGDRPNGPPLYSYQVLSKYIYQSYGAHKDAPMANLRNGCRADRYIPRLLVGG